MYAIHRNAWSVEVIVTVYTFVMSRVHNTVFGPAISRLYFRYHVYIATNSFYFNSIYYIGVYMKLSYTCYAIYCYFGGLLMLWLLVAWLKLLYWLLPWRCDPQFNNMARYELLWGWKSTEACRDDFRIVATFHVVGKLGRGSLVNLLFLSIWQEQFTKWIDQPKS